MPAVTVRRRSSALPIVFVVLFLGLLLAVAAVAAYVLAGNSIPIPFSNGKTFGLAKTEAPVVEVVPPDSESVILSGRAIKAFRAVTLEDVWDSQRKRTLRTYVSKKEAEDNGLLLTADQVVGRVLKSDKLPGRPFVEGDFLPKGTRSGLVAGIPTGMRAMRVNLEQVRGLYGLNPGDRFDLVATVPVKSDAADELKRIGGVHGSQLQLEATLGNIGKQATVNVIVQAGVVVEEATTIEIPIAGGGLHGHGSHQTKPIQEVVIAVAPDEVAPLTEALAVEAQLSVVPRSGRPDDDKDSVTPSSRPWSPFTDGGQDGDGTKPGGSMKFVEQVNGSKREIVPVPTESTQKKGN